MGTTTFQDDTRPTPSPTRTTTATGPATKRRPAKRLKGALRTKPWAIGYLAFFFVAAMTLLAFARSGASTLAVQGLVIVFVVAATLWVRGQYIDALDDSPWVLPGDVTVGMLIIATILGVTWLATEWNGLGLAALFLLWIAGSAIVSRMRGTTPAGPARPHSKFFAWANAHRRSIGGIAAGAGLVLVIAGLLLIGRGSQTLLIVAAVMIFLGLAIGLPVGTSLLSEITICRLSGGKSGNPPMLGRIRVSTIFAVVGFAAFAALTWVVAEAANTKLIYLVMAALFLVILATTSSTHADAALLMAAVALLGVTPQQQSWPDLMTRTAPASSAGQSTLVALGDSYMSGEGASVYYTGTDDGDGNQCRRAPTAWAALASENGFDAFEFLACSGAETGNIVYDPRASTQTKIPSEEGAKALSAQLSAKRIIGTQDGDTGTQLDHWRVDQAKRGLVPSMVVVSLGGNDAGFSTIGTMCLAPGSCEAKEDLWMGSLEQVRTQLRLAYAEISETFPDTPVVTVGYPDPIALDVNPCRQVSLTAHERTFIHEFLTGNGTQDGLNDVIEETSKEFGFYYSDKSESALAHAHLQLCDPLNDGRPGLNFVGLRSIRGAAEQRFNPANWIHSSLHPNERGHAALLQAFQAWRASQPTTLAPRAPIPPGIAAQRDAAVKSWLTSAPAQAQASVDKAGQCDLFESSASGCRTQGSDWTQQQLRHTLLTKGVWVCLGAALLAWVTAVGFFADRRRGWLRHQQRQRQSGDE